MVPMANIMGVASAIYNGQFSFLLFLNAEITTKLLQNL